nr:MAG TPA: hypothetical protein [Caudoviricetes sp.]
MSKYHNIYIYCLYNYLNINKKQTGFIIKYFDEPSLFILWQ